MRRAHRHQFRHGHPVDAVHEIDEVDEPHPGEKEACAFDPPRHLRQHLRLLRERRRAPADGDALHHQTGCRGRGAHIVDRADHRQQHGCRGHGQQLADVIVQDQRATTARPRPRRPRSVATTTATPPPCGVGSRWDERAFGFAIAWRASHGRSSTSSAKLRKSARWQPDRGPKDGRWLVQSLLFGVHPIIRWICWAM